MLSLRPLSTLDVSDHSEPGAPARVNARIPSRPAARSQICDDVGYGETSLLMRAPILPVTGAHGSEPRSDESALPARTLRGMNADQHELATRCAPPARQARRFVGATDYIAGIIQSSIPAHPAPAVSDLEDDRITGIPISSTKRPALPGLGEYRHTWPSAQNWDTLCAHGFWPAAEQQRSSDKHFHGMTPSALA